ncbi:MFS transporter [Streptococcus marmotae]|uniref:MFS transporter n=1 Tax=Streptococcus marmotae TaxID=1825069 RepID=UPI0008369BB3|nr:MFS transporter [Streptococcus marmotae]
MNKQFKITLGILAMAFVSQSNAALAPSVPSIAQSFPDIPISVIQSIVTIGGFTGFFSALLCGKFQEYVSLRKLGLFALSLVGVFGILPIFYHSNFYVLLVSSGVVGFGAGMLTVVSPSLISTYFEGDARSSLLGKQTAFQGIGNMLILALGGFLASYSWVNNYYVYLLPIASFIIFFLTIPQDKQSKSGGEQSGNVVLEKGSNKVSLTSPFILLLLAISVSVTIIVSGSFNNIAIFTEQYKIGDSSVSGLALSVLSLGMISAGLFINQFIKIFKSLTLTTGYLIAALSFICFLIFHNQIGLFIGSYFTGISAGIIMTRLVYLLTSIVKEELISKAVSLYSAFTSAGFFISAFLLNSIAGLFTTDLTTGSFIVSVALSILIIGLLIITRVEYRSLNIQTEG